MKTPHQLSEEAREVSGGNGLFVAAVVALALLLMVAALIP